MSSNGKNPLDTGLDVLVNSMTFGLLGYEGDGQFGKGVTTTSVDEGIGEITGRNAQRKALMQQEDAINAEKEASTKAAANELAVRATNDLAASNKAGSARRRGTLGGARDVLGI